MRYDLLEDEMWDDFEDDLDDLSSPEDEFPSEADVFTPGENEFPALITRKISASVGAGGRNNPDDVRSVQLLLNTFILARRLPGLSMLTIDGAIGPSTINAIRKFQRVFVGMRSPDGRVDPGGSTLGALNGSIFQVAPSSSSVTPSTPKGPLPDVSVLMLRSAPGILAKRTHRYGLPETIEALKAIGRSWKSTHPSGPLIRILDISRVGGGKFRPHGSHRMGIDIDIGLMRNDGQNRSVNFKTNPSKYSRTLTQEMIDTIHANRILNVHRLWFADKGVKHVNHDNKHNNHVHVRFCIPRKYSLVAMKRAAFPSGTKGTYGSC